MSDNYRVNATYETLQWVHAYIKKLTPTTEDLSTWLSYQMGVISDGGKTDPKEALDDLKRGDC